MLVGIIDCQPLHGYPRIQKLTRSEGFDKCFEKLLTPASERIGAKLKLATVHSLPYETASDFDAFLVTGSFSSAYENAPWIIDLSRFLIFLHEKARVPMIGICFGHQIIAQTFGGTVELNPSGAEIGLHSFALSSGWSQLLHEIDCDNLLQHGSICTLPYFHNDHVSSLPPNALSFGGNSVTPHQGFLIPRVALAFQGHPEFASDLPMYNALLQERSPIPQKPVSEQDINDNHEQIADIILLWIRAVSSD
mmetsp:Transcript_5838/g.10340  ORF Transcript_5838/g.10340 Transcript_5838/m.10340 type:complete len:250 (+) Transcript_5838:835-1584(+)